MLGQERCSHFPKLSVFRVHQHIEGNGYIGYGIERIEYG